MVLLDGKKTSQDIQLEIAEKVEQLKAEIVDGVLRINVPRVERAEPKVIDVKVG